MRYRSPSSIKTPPVSSPHSHTTSHRHASPSQEPFWPEGLGINRGMHNGCDACWVAHKWACARGGEGGETGVLEERQHLHDAFTRQMHGRNRTMLRGYTAANTRVASSQAHRHYSPDPASRYNGFSDRLFWRWAEAARMGAAPGPPRSDVGGVGPMGGAAPGCTRV